MVQLTTTTKLFDLFVIVLKSVCTQLLGRDIQKNIDTRTHKHTFLHIGLSDLENRFQWWVFNRMHTVDATHWNDHHHWHHNNNNHHPQHHYHHNYHYTPYHNHNPTMTIRHPIVWVGGGWGSKCPYVCLFVCVCVCLSVCVFTFEVPFNGLFAPTSRSRMSNIFRDSESLRKSNEKKCSHIWREKKMEAG